MTNFSYNRKQTKSKYFFMGRRKYY